MGKAAGLPTNSIIKASSSFPTISSLKLECQSDTSHFSMVSKFLHLYDVDL